jgi:hypothetical protein
MIARGGSSELIINEGDQSGGEAFVWQGDFLEHLHSTVLFDVSQVKAYEQIGGQQDRRSRRRPRERNRQRLIVLCIFHDSGVVQGARCTKVSLVSSSVIRPVHIVGYHNQQDV